MGFESYAKKFPLICGGYYGMKEAMFQYQEKVAKPFLMAQSEGVAWNKRLPVQLRDSYLFENRSRDCKKLCMVLAGYKPELWPVVFRRLQQVLSGDVDVCILTSGICSEELRQLCAENGWSYLATRKNKVCRIQNLAIYLHPNAQYLYKLDEDIFLTDGFFEGLYRTHQAAAKQSGYEIGFVAPLIPVNGYGYVRVLDKLDLTSDWEKQFGPAIFTDGIHHHPAILEQVAAARYMWGETQPELRNIDELNRQWQRQPLEYRVCPIRFSIGAILFTREAWLDWGMFPVDWSAGMGLDEEWIARCCALRGRSGVVSENVLVGHLGYGPQTQEMLKYFSEGNLRV